MYPIALVAIILFAVVAERGIFWFLLGRRRDATQLENTLGAMENSDFKAAVAQTQGSNDPVVRMIYHGLTHLHGSLKVRFKWPPAWKLSGPGGSWCSSTRALRWPRSSGCWAR